MIRDVTMSAVERQVNVKYAKEKDKTATTPWPSRPVSLSTNWIYFGNFKCDISNDLNTVYSDDDLDRFAFNECITTNGIPKIIVEDSGCNVPMPNCIIFSSDVPCTWTG